MNTSMDQNLEGAREREDNMNATSPDNNTHQVSDESLPNEPTNETSRRVNDSVMDEEVSNSTLSQPVEVERVERSRVRRATGPTSEAGRRRASRNSTKHGIFAKATVLPWESIGAYRALERRFRDGFRPEDEMEKYLVEKAVSIEWRHIRFLTAEGAELCRGRELITWDRKSQLARETGAILTRSAAQFNESDFKHGMILEIHNPGILEKCQELLIELRCELETDSFDLNRSAEILERVFGTNAHLSDGLLQAHQGYCDAIDAQSSDEKSETESCEIVEDLRKRFLSEVCKEIDRLRAYREEYVSVESARLKLDSIRYNAPECMLKYDLSLDRSFDRVISQFERWRRLRRGLQAAPQIHVNI